MNYKKTNISNILKALIQVPIDNMKSKGIHLSAMISYLYCNKMFKGNFETLKEVTDVK